MATNSNLPGVGKISRTELAGVAFGLDEEDRRYTDAVRACEVCGKEAASSDMIAFHHVISSPGHFELSPFQHPEIEHWACSIEHFSQLEQRVAEEMAGFLRRMHAEKPESVHHAK